jgi:hypothetical protein
VARIDWRPEDDETLLKSFAAGMDGNAVAKLLNRTRHAVYRRAYRLRQSSPRNSRVQTVSQSRPAATDVTTDKPSTGGPSTAKKVTSHTAFMAGETRNPLVALADKRAKSDRDQMRTELALIDNSKISAPDLVLLRAAIRRDDMEAFRDLIERYEA